VWRPERVRYRVTADPGTYVSVFLIGPSGRVSLLNPYERAIKGSARRELLRETNAGYASGESYLVAVATKSAEHNAALVRLSRNETRLSAGYYSAESSMDELVTKTVHAAGDDFSVAYASFRMMGGDYPGVFASNLYDQSCEYGALFPGTSFLGEGSYGRSFAVAPFYDVYGNRANFLSYSDILNLDAGCRTQIFAQPFFVFRAPAPSTPAPPRRDSTAFNGDSVPKLLPPIGPRMPLPFNPDPRNANPGTPTAMRGTPSLRIDPIAAPSGPVETGAPMPQVLVDKIKKSRMFNQGYALTEYLAAALLDQAWHTQPADAPLRDVNAFENAALTRFNINLPQVPPRYHTTYFSHIWSSGYSAAYYAHLWSEVLDDDAYYWFREHGGMTRANGQRFRDMILSRGGKEDPAEMYRAFRGRDPKVEPLLIERGLKEAPNDAVRQ